MGVPFLKMGLSTFPPMPPGADELDSSLFVRGLSVIMYWRLAGNFRASVRHRDGIEGTAEGRYLLEAQPRELKYTLMTDEREVIERFDGYAHTIERNGRIESFEVHNLTPEAYVARLAFPMSTSIWGRTTDAYRFSGLAVARGEEIELELVNRFDPDVSGSLTVNSRQRMIVRRETPTRFLAYEDIESM